LQFVFADHTLDIDRRELRRGSDAIAVEPQVFDLLVYLVENRDHVVSKDDLIASVWRGRIVFDSTLTSRIWRTTRSPDHRRARQPGVSNHAVRNEAYFGWLEMLLNVLFSNVPRVFTATMIATEIPAAIRPYSMAVAPASSFRKRRTSFLMGGYSVVCARGGCFVTLSTE
jgi:hypothetical protein